MLSIKPGSDDFSGVRQSIYETLVPQSSCNITGGFAFFALRAVRARERSSKLLAFGFIVVGRHLSCTLYGLPFRRIGKMAAFGKEFLSSSRRTALVSRVITFERIIYFAVY